MENKTMNRAFQAILLAVAVALGLLGGIGKTAPADTGTAEPEKTPETAKPEEPEKTPETETAAVHNLVAETGTGIKVTSAADWEKQFPNQFETYMKNNDNDEVVEYTEEHPYIKTLYEGYGFAKSYGSARGHTYVITDLYATGRPHKLANCFTCKTSSFTAAVLNDGDSVYAMAFDDFKNQVTDDFGCFHCHQNEPGTLYVTHRYLSDAVADDLDQVAAETLSCGQCHSEYYFDPATKATSFAYRGLAAMNPDDMLAYENAIVDGEGNMFADWVDESTGVRKLKVQHPEFETIGGSGSVHGLSTSMLQLTCADCHMGTKKADDGTEFTNHEWLSPLDMPDLLESNCSRCHKDLAAEVAEKQEAYWARTDEIAEKLVKLDEALSAAVADGTLSEEDLEACRLASRNAQWYWDFVFVENSNGVHNSSLTKHCLDQAETFLDEANSYLKA